MVEAEAKAKEEAMRKRIDDDRGKGGKGERVDLVDDSKEEACHVRRALVSFVTHGGGRFVEEEGDK